MNVALEKLIEISEEAGLDESAVRTDYSGRYMNGSTCVGFTVYKDADLLSLGAALFQILGVDEASEFVSKTRTDSMGRGTIVYFPGIVSDEEDTDQY